MPLRTIARITAFRPGQSPPPVSIPMRMRPGTYIAAAGRPLALALALLAGCGGGQAATTQRVPDGPLTIYLSAPRRGIEASAGRAVAAGARLALDDAGARVGDRPVRLLQLDASKPQST